MSRLWTALAALGLALLAAVPAAACSVMIDTSASMGGFTASPKFSHLVEVLGDLCREHWTFGANLQPGPARLDRLDYNGVTTELGPSLRDWETRSSARRVLILTDNVADDGSGRPDAGQAQFYDLLRSPKSGFTRIAAVLIRLPFRGLVYSASGHSKAMYPGGPRALMLYVIERATGDHDHDASLDTASLGVPSTDMAVLSLKPFESAGDALGVTLSSGAQRNVWLEDGVLELARRSGTRPYDFTLDATVQPSPRWDFGGLPLAADLTFPATGTFSTPVTTPCRVTPTASPAGDRPFGLVVACTAPSAVASLDSAAQKRLSNRRTDRSGVLEVRLSARSSQIVLGPQLQQWSFNGDGSRLAEPDPAVQGSIYRLGELLAGMAPTEIHPVVLRLPVSEKLYFFNATPFWLVAAIAAVAAAAALLVATLSRARVAEVVGGSDGLVRRDIRFAGRIDVRLAEFRRVVVWVTPFLVLALGGASPRVLPPQGGQVDLGGGRRLTIRIRAGAKAASLARGPRRGMRGR